MSLMELEELPDVGMMAPSLGTLTSRQLVTAAIIAGEAGYPGGPDPDPERIRWALRVFRKASWYQLRKRHRKHIPWDLWNSHHHPI